MSSSNFIQLLYAKYPPNYSYVLHSVTFSPGLNSAMLS